MSLDIVRGRLIVLGVSGSIAAYKAVELARHLTQAGATVQVIMTRSATEFVQPLTFQALTYRPVEIEMFSGIDERAAGHVSMGIHADCIVIAPATAHVVARLAHGFADDLLATTVLASSAPVIVAPAMETHMWQNAATQQNVSTLRARGVHVVDPEAGELASGMVGQGRLATLERIEAEIVDAVRVRSRRLAGRRVVVTAGPTLEPIDPVRVLTNRSSGKMGYAVATAAREAGADVTLITGPTALASPAGVRLVPIETVAELRDAVLASLPDADAVIMAAAVSDFRAADASASKLKKKDVGDEMTLRLVRTVDVLSAVAAARRPGTLVVGFKAETGDPVAEAERMLKEKGLDLVVANDVSQDVFGSESDQVTFVSADGAETLPRLAKTEVADRLIERLAARLG
ncbi:MAG: bifunctional phosphopantothenoylcysteine decarboxylase/phosphopantothenate--cysteine ligase CoaBC [Chloroflexi bacterium]|nr:bifunctional phosphopantothenoylcysteine decarboxylase/phosphopantothenate--cysteine ligase CoaBC [Chloroflexota bacterium]MBI2983325.1 bifunctional phosphopantothenoylcysteine decarboxylase/phosphopantothenate--cysteine ligase CoaBC [Chloroflexota bacterium]